VQAAVEALPDELTGIAGEVQVNFPWGGLLRTVLAADSLASLRRLCIPNALLKVVVGLDLERDQGELRRLELPTLSADYLNTALTLKYREAGFDLLQIEQVMELMNLIVPGRSDWQEIRIVSSYASSPALSESNQRCFECGDLSPLWLRSRTKTPTGWRTQVLRLFPSCFAFRNGISHLCFVLLTLSLGRVVLLTFSNTFSHPLILLVFVLAVFLLAIFV
jgi:hypothetical protein